MALDKKIEPLKEILSDAFKRIETIADKRENLVSGVLTGIAELDRLTDGLQPGQLIIIGGSDGSLKTNLSLYLATNIAQNGDGAAYFTWMMKERIGFKLLSMLGEISASRMRSGRLEGGDWLKLVRAIGRFDDLPIHICNYSHPSVEEISEIVETLREEHEIRLVIIDYLQLIYGFCTGGFDEERQNHILEQLKKMAVEFSLSVLVNYNLKKPFFSRTPSLLDIVTQHGRHIAKHADTIIFSSPGYENETSAPNELRHYVIIAQQMNGSTGVVELSNDLAQKLALYPN